MPTTTATLRAAINGGSPQTGGITAAAGDTVQLTAADYTGWATTNSAAPAARWEIYDYSPSFACPAGWSTDVSTGAYYYLGNTQPPAFTLGGFWKYMLRLLVAGGIRNGAVDPTLKDESTAISVPSGAGLVAIGENEGTQFDAQRRWTRAYNDNVVAAGGLVAVQTDLVNDPTYGGLDPSGVTASNTKLAAALTAQAAGTIKGRLYLPRGTYKVTTGSLGAASNMIEFAPGAKLVVVTGNTLTIAIGNIVADPNQQIYDVSASGAHVVYAASAPTCAHVGHFGAVADNATDCGPPINAAVYAHSLRVGVLGAAAAGCTVQFQGGSYRITTATTVGNVLNVAGVSVSYSGVELVGLGKHATFLVFADQWAYNRVAFSKFGASDLEPQAITDVGIVGVTVYCEGDTLSNFSDVQFNRAARTTCDVGLYHAVANANGSKIGDGISYAWGCDVGKCYFEAFQSSKASLYLAWCSRIIASGISVSPTWNGGNAAGVQVTSAYECEVDVQTFNSNGYGYIFNPPSNASVLIGTVTNQTHFTVVFPSATSQVFASALGVLNTSRKKKEELLVLSATDTGDHLTWTIVLSAAPNQTLTNGQAIWPNYRPSHNVTIRGASVGHALNGVDIRSALEGVVQTGINILGMNIDGAGVGQRGISAVSYDGLNVLGCQIKNHTNAGIVLSDIAYTTGAVQDMARRTNVAANTIQDNGVVGIDLISATDVNIAASNTIAVTAGGAQTYPILTAADSNGKRSSNVTIGRFNHPGYSAGLVQAASAGDAVLVGHYDLGVTASPEAAQYGPLGSLAGNDTTGDLFIKQTAGSSPSGWNSVITNGSATGGVLILTKVGSSLLVGESGGASFMSMAATGIIVGPQTVSWVEDPGGDVGITIATKTANSSAPRKISIIGGAPKAGGGAAGGAIDISTPAGDGAGVAGTFRALVGGTVRLSANGTGLGLYAAPPVAQATRVGQITDSTGGTPSSTLAAIAGSVYATDSAAIINALASLAAKQNAMEVRLSQAGGGIGAWA